MSPPADKPLPEDNGRLLALAIVAGLLAGVASLLAGEAILKRYQSDLTSTRSRNIRTPKTCAG